jgi:hypothetical protein
MSTSIVNVLENRPCIHIVWSVPASEEESVDAFWKEHEAWMREKHVMGPGQADGPQLLHFYIAKGPEMENALANPPVPTGNILYIMSESYLDGAQIGLHMEQGNTEKKEWFEKMLQLNEQYGKHMDIGTTLNFTGLSDTQDFAIKSLYQPGDPCIHVIWSVPADKVEEIDAFWKTHETWMRGSHDFKRDGDDSERPRLTSFNIRKGAEMENALATPPVPTGNTLYIMSESYAAASGIGKHMELGQTNMPEWFKQMLEYNAQYGKHMDMGSTAVFTHLDK